VSAGKSPALKSRSETRKEKKKKMEIKYEIRIVNMDGRYERREYLTYEEARKWADMYNGELYKVTRERVEK
jgi:hypothetical protein